MASDIYLGGIAQVRAYRTIQASVSEIVKAHGLGSVSEWFMLSSIHYGNTVTSKDLAALLEVEAPLITRLLGNLLDAKLVTVSPHLTDGRAKIIHPTPAASQLVMIVEAALATKLARLFKGVSRKDTDTYLAVLDKIISNGTVEQ